MQIQLLPSTMSSAPTGGAQYLTSVLLNRQVAIDVGCLGFYGSPAEQAEVKHVFITHTHIDHLASLPIFIENVYRETDDCVTLYGSAAVLECLQRDLFNDRVWPDFFRLSQGQAPFFRFQELRAETPVVVAGLRLTPIPVDHIVPTLGYLVEELATGKTVLFPSDTGPTQRIWQIANQQKNLQMVFLEAAFPNRLEKLARNSKHLTTAMFLEEMRKLAADAPFFAVHVKAKYRDEIIGELAAAGSKQVRIAEFGKIYEV